MAVAARVADGVRLDLGRQFVHGPSEVGSAGHDAAAGVVDSLPEVLGLAGELERQRDVLGINVLIKEVLVLLHQKGL